MAHNSIDHSKLPETDMDGGRFHCSCACCSGECAACAFEEEYLQDKINEFYVSCRAQGMSASEASQAIIERFY